MQLVFSLNETVSLVLRSASPNITPAYIKELADLTSVISAVFGHCKLKVVVPLCTPLRVRIMLIRVGRFNAKIQRRISFGTSGTDTQNSKTNAIVIHDISHIRVDHQESGR